MKAMFLKAAPIPYCKVQQGQFGLEKFMKKKSSNQNHKHHIIVKSYEIATA